MSWEYAEVSVPREIVITKGARCATCGHPQVERPEVVRQRVMDWIEANYPLRVARTGGLSYGYAPADAQIRVTVRARRTSIRTGVTA